MQCTKCGYVMTDFDKNCPRCPLLVPSQDVAQTVVAPEPPTPTSDAEAVLFQGRTTNDAANGASPALDETDTEPPPALVPCPICGHSVSRLAIQCPSCGHPLAPATAKSVRTPYRLASIDSDVTPLPERTLLPQQAAPPPVPVPTLTDSPVVPAFSVTFAAGKRPRIRTGSGGLLTFVVIALAAILLGLILRGVTASHIKSNVPAVQLSQAGKLIAGADADAYLFQQDDLSPDQAAASLQSRTQEYQQASELCAAGDTPAASRAQQAITSGLRQVKADKDAQAARLLTEEVAGGIARFKGQTLTDAQAAQIRLMLRSQCQAALVQCEQSLQSDPANAVALAERVHALRYLGDSDAAGAALAHALAVQPDNPLLLAEKGK